MTEINWERNRIRMRNYWGRKRPRRNFMVSTTANKQNKYEFLKNLNHVYLVRAKENPKNVVLNGFLQYFFCVRNSNNLSHSSMPPINCKVALLKFKSSALKFKIISQEILRMSHISYAAPNPTWSDYMSFFVLIVKFTLE